MCLAIFKNENIELPSKDILKIGFNNNPHGAGFAYCKFFNYDYQPVTICKGFFDFEHFYKTLINTVKKEHACLIHFRYATHGSKDVDNCHPFRVLGNGAMIHNGVINNGNPSDKHSDTYFLSKDISADKIINHDIFVETNNKVAIITPTTYSIYGNWIEKDGVLYSNGTYRKDLTEYQKEDKDYQICDNCGNIGKDYFSTDVGYHFCNECMKNKIKIHQCKNCGKPTTNFYCNACNELGYKTEYFF